MGHSFENVAHFFWEDEMISNKLKIAIYLSSRRHYQIAQAAGLHPSTLSKILNGIEEVHPNDPRVLRIGEVIGIPEEECFENQPNS